MKVWHDDVRVPPPGYHTWVRTNEDARAILDTGIVTEINLDHDLGHEYLDPTQEDVIYFKGDAADDGVELVKWMLEPIELFIDKGWSISDIRGIVAVDFLRRIPEKIIIHSWNPDGAARMQKVLSSCKIEAEINPWREDPYTLREAESTQ